MKKENGQAAILIIFVLGLISVLIALSLSKTGFSTSISGRSGAGSSRAFYAANSGIEQAMYEIGLVTDFTTSPEVSFTLEDSTVKYTVENKNRSGENTDGKIKLITATGTYGNYQRILKAEVETSTIKPGFLHAIQAGLGGFELRNTSLITAKDGQDGNVYSRGDVMGAKNDHDGSGCKNSASKVNGLVFARGDVKKLADSDSGVCVEKEIWANNLLNCYTGEKGRWVNSNSISDCPAKLGYEEETDLPDDIPLPDMGLPLLRSQTNKINHYVGDCIIGTSIGCYQMVNGVATIGDIFIDGNLIKPNSVNLNFSGAVWVQNDINLGSNSTIGIDPETVNNDTKGLSKVIAAGGKITSSSNITFQSAMANNALPLPKKVFLLFISDREAPAGEMCDDPSISLYSNSDSVLFYGTKGCVLVNAHSEFYGAIIGEKIRVENNSTIEYDPELAGSFFGLTRGGGWITNWFIE